MAPTSHAREMLNAARRMAGGVRRFDRDEDAQLIFIGIFGAMAFAVFLMFMFNHGFNIQQKVRMQNAADASVLAAGEVMATGLNMISDNNVAMAELIALKSVMQGLASSAGDPKLVLNYYGVSLATYFLQYVPYIGPICKVIHMMYMVAWNYAVLICEQRDNLEDAADMCDKQVAGLDKFNVGIRNTFPLWSAFTASKIGEQNGARITRTGNFLSFSVPPTLAYPIHSDLPDDEGKGVWLRAIKYGSHEDTAGPIPVSERYGFTHVYNEQAQGVEGDFYELSEGPFTRYVADTKAYQWYLPYLDPGALVGWLWDLFSDLFKKWLKSLLPDFLGGEDYEDPDPLEEALNGINNEANALKKKIGGLFDKHGNDTFERLCTNHLAENIEALPKPIVLKDFATTYRELGPVTVVYGGNQEPHSLAGRGRISAPFARRLGGFESPRHPQNVETVPYGVVALAQAQVYNPVSWDTFTQYWDYKLTRVQKIPDVWSPLANVDYVNVLLPVLDIEKYSQDLLGQLGLSGEDGLLNDAKGLAQDTAGMAGMPFAFSPSFELYH